MSIQIRQAVPEDLNALRDLSIRSFVNAYAAHNTAEDMEQYLREHFNEEVLAAELHDPRYVYFLAVGSGRMLGYIKLDRADVKKNFATRAIEIARLYTDPDWVSKGIGRRIVEAAVEFAHSENYNAIWLSAWQKNFRAVNFYQREGFRIEGLTRFVLGKDVQDDFVMVKKINPMETVIETERLLLRRFVPVRDAEFFKELLNSPGWIKYIGDRNVHTTEAAEEYLRTRVVKHFIEHGFGSYVVIEKSSGKAIGNAGLFKRPHLDAPDIGYAFLPEYHGKGYAYEASLAVKNYAMGLGIKKLYGVTVAYNERSIHLLKKLGLKFERTFRMEGDAEELCLYAIHQNGAITGQ